jgi:hypothetical protein
MTARDEETARDDDDARGARALELLFDRWRQAAPVEIDPAAPLPDHFDHYVNVRRVASGGMGDFYLAHDERLDVTVGLKTLKWASPEHKELLLHEAQQVARLGGDQNVVTIMGLEYYEEQPIIRMGYIEGPRLPRAGFAGGERTRAAHERVVELLLVAARALGRAHLKGIFHGDFKPDNVIVTPEGTLKIIDFGLSRNAGVAGPADAKGAGTAAYMAPEQARGAPVDHKSDLYSFGVVLHEQLTGELPADRRPEALAAKLGDPILAAIVAKCLREDPAERYADMRAVVDDLTRWRRREPVSVVPDTTSAKARRLVRKHPVAAALISFIVVAAVPSILWYRHDVAAREAREVESTLAQLASRADAAAEDYAEKMRRSADALGATPPGALVPGLVAWNAEIAKHPAKSLAELLGRAERLELQRLVAAMRAANPELPVDHWLLLDAAGTMVARTPEVAKKAVVGLDFHDRDYFTGAVRHLGAKGLAAVHVSFAYQSVADDTFKVTLSRPLVAADGKTLLGVLAVSTTARLGPDLDVVLVGPRDPGQLTAAEALRQQLVVLEHPELAGSGGAVTTYSAPLAAVSRRDCGHELEKPSSKASDHVLRTFRDPLADPADEGSWRATVAPIARTGLLIVTEQKRR